jgi:hypothetical protein
MVTKNYKLFLAILLILVILPSALGLDTKVVIKSKKNQKITLNFMDIGGKGTLEKGLLADLPTDDAGYVTGLFRSETANYVQFSVMRRDLEGTMMRFSDGALMKIYRDIKTGWEYSLDLTVDNSQPVKVKALDDAVPFTAPTTPAEPPAEVVKEEVANVVVKEEPPVKEESTPIQENKEAIPSNDAQINNIKNTNWTTIVYIVLSVLIILIIIFLIAFLSIYLYGKRKDAVSSKVYFGSPMKSTLTSKDERILKDAQNRLRSAEEDIRKVLNKDEVKRKPDNRIKELERKLDEERRELDKLKRRY